jgi:ectoine hydroxylase-related dioxygenase (phytanoyl-CoA dioxygenase family)
MEPTAHLDERFDRLIDDPRIWQPIASINGSDRLSIFSDKLNVKRPGGAPFPWHQEGPYWAYGAKNLESIVTALICIDEGTLENGCLWLIKGSHKHGALKGLEDRGVLGALYTDVDQIDGEYFPVALPAGSVLWFHHQAVHGSQTNRSHSDRRALLFAYQDAGLPRWELGESRDVNNATG